MNNQKQNLFSSTNPSHGRSSMKSRFTRGFLRALMRMREQKYRNQPTSRREILRRYRRVKIAADKSMAVAVGSRRAWSRALLRRIHHQARRYNNHQSTVMIRNEKKKNEEEGIGGDEGEEVGGFGEARELRKLVPGGEAMDLCSLLDETAHYIKCLATQVQVMRSIDHFYSI